MYSDRDNPGSHEDRRPGDITVTPVRTGYLLGRVLPQRGPGPWWEYIGVELDFADAVAHAQRLAARDNVNAWFLEGEDRWRPLPLDDPAPAPAPGSSPEADAAYQNAMVRTRRVNAPPRVKASQRSRRR